MLPMPLTFEQTVVESRCWVDAVALGAQMPLLVRGLYYEGGKPGSRPPGRERAAVYAVVRRELDHTPLIAANVLHAVVRVLMHHMSTGEIDHIIAVLPRPIAQLWLDAV